MATNYPHPGVYVEEIPSGVKPIEAVGTSLAAFVGFAKQGPMNVPTLIASWDDYVSVFGGIQPDEITVTGSSVPMGDPMGQSVLAFFLNGGTKTYIVRIAHGAPVVATGTIPVNLATFTAITAGSAGNNLKVVITGNADGSAFKVEVGVQSGATFTVKKTFDPTSLDPADAKYLKTLVNTSSLVKVDFDDAKAADLIAALENKVTSVLFSGGADTATKATGTLASPTQTLLTFSAINEGVWGDDLCVKLTQKTDGNFTLEVGLGSTSFKAKEKFTVSLDSTKSEYIEFAVNGASKYITVKVDDQPTALASMTGNYTITFDGGSDGLSPETADYDTAFATLVKVRDVNILLLPNQYWAADGSGNAVLSHGISHCEATASRMILIDPPPATELTTEAGISDLGLPTSTYAVSYYPWIQVANPYYNAETNPGAAPKVLVSPGAFGAGMWAKTDGRRGVWKAPAGVEAGLLAVAATQYDVEDAEQDSLNPAGLNAVRKIPGYGTVIWGSRTLATRADPEWRYVPVRRTAIFIEQSIYNGIQWAVFEPNDHRLWSALRVNIESFLNGLFRSGAFQGEKVSDAYFVRCGLGSTMTQGDIDRGQVIVDVGFAPLKPAEFVIIRIQQMVGQQ